MYSVYCGIDFVTRSEQQTMLAAVIPAYSSKFKVSDYNLIYKQMCNF